MRHVIPDSPGAPRGRRLEWHLRKVFAKLGIASRRDLPAVLS